MAIRFHPLLFSKRAVRPLEEQKYTSDEWVDLSYDMHGRGIVEGALPTMTDVEPEGISTHDRRLGRTLIPAVEGADFLTSYHTTGKSENGRGACHTRK